MKSKPLRRMGWLMFRVDSLSTKPSPELGVMTVGGGSLPLSQYELIVIIGPNGSGKTSITECLHTLDGRLSLTRPNGETFDPMRDAATELLYANSDTLLSSFRDMSESLAKCAGAARLREEVALLQKLVPTKVNVGKYRLDLLLPAQHDAMPSDVNAALDRLDDAERHADGTVGTQHRYDLASYNEIGVAIGMLLSKPWIPVEAGDVASMQKSMERSEAASRPEERMLGGLQDAVGSLDACKARCEEIARDTNAKECCNTARQEVAKAVGQARTALSYAGATIAIAHDASPDRLAHALESACSELKRRQDELDSQIAAYDALANLRHMAHEYLTTCTDEQCPVCERAMPRVTLLSQLRHGESLSNTALSRAREEWRSVTDAYEGAASAKATLLQATASLATADRDLVAWRGRWHHRITTLAEDLRPHTDWDESVVNAVADATRELHTIATRPEWSSPPSAESVESIVSAMQELARTCTACEGKLSSLKASQNRGIDEADRLFPQLTALGDVLVAQASLNALRWEPRWQAHADHAAKVRALDCWKRAVKSAIADRTTRLSALHEEILGDPGVNNRFARLLRATGHPLLANPQLRPSEVTSSATGERLAWQMRRNESPILSEGYTVLVNLAALIAITGHAQPGQAHRAGWLLLDEPTNGLDDGNRSRVAAYLGSLTVEDMPRQMFVTTFDESFAKDLISHARSKGRRRTLEVQLPPWNGRFVAAPPCISHDPVAC